MKHLINKQYRRFSKALVLPATAAFGVLVVSAGGATADRGDGLSSSVTNASADVQTTQTASMPELLHHYAQDYRFAEALFATFDSELSEFQRLQELTEQEALAEFPSGGYEDALTAAQARYIATENLVYEARAAASRSLRALTNGKQLTDQALSELHRMLGI